MLSRSLSAACVGLLAAAAAATPARAQVRVSKEIPAAPAPAAPAAPTSPTGGAMMGAPAASASPATTSAPMSPDMAPSATAPAMAPAMAPAPGTPAPAVAPAAMSPSGMSPSAMNASGMAPDAVAPAAAAAVAGVPPRAPSPAGGEAPEEMYTDPKILAVASISNFNEIDPSQVALERATRPEVKEFARMMIDMHTRLEASARAMAARKGLAPVDNALSLQLKRNGPPTLEMLRLKSGADFDASYVLQQIQSHDLTLKTLDTSLIPAARDPELKTMLRDVVRPQVVDHYNRVMAIHHAMMGMQPPAQPAR